MKQMEKMNKYTTDTCRSLIDKFLSKGYTGRDLISSLYERLPEHEESIARMIRYVPDINLNNIFYDYEIDVLCQNFREVFYLCYGDDPRNPLFDGETNDLVECIGGMMGIKSGSNILIPYNGINFALHFSNNYEFLTEDAYAKIIARHLGDSCIRISDTVGSSNEIQVSEAIKELCASNRTFDYIYALPHKLLTHTSDIQQNIIQLLSLLNKDGAMALFLDDSVCSEPNWINFREQIVINNNLSVTIVRIHNLYAGSIGEGCIFLFRKQPNKTITFADLTHHRFIGYDGVDVDKVLTAYRRKDPEFFISIDKANLKDLYDLDPRHYPIDDETRIKGLIHSFLEQDSHRDINSFVLSILAYTDKIRHIQHVGHYIVNLEDVMSRENIEFLTTHIELVIRLCYTDILDIVHGNHKDPRFYAYIEIVSKLINNSKRPKRNLLLPNGGIDILPKLKDFYRVTSWVENRGEAVLEHIIQSIMHIDAEIFPYHERRSGNELFSHIISIKGPLKNSRNDSTERPEEIIHLLENKLDCNGIMAILLPIEACYKAHWLPLREFLVRKHSTFKTTVISFRTRYALFLIEKSSPWDDDWREYQRIKLVDGINIHEHDINVDAIVAAAKGNHSDSVALLPLDNLDKNLNFIAAPYLSRNFAEEKADTRYLREVVSIIPNVSRDDIQSYTVIDKIISRKDLSSEYLNCKIRINDTERDPIRVGVSYSTANGGYFTYSNNKILIGKIEEQPNNNLVMIDNDVIHFRVDTSQTSLDYILKALTSDKSIAKQAELLSKAYNSYYDTTEFIEALLSIRLVIPTLEGQKTELLADSQKEYTNKTEELEKAFNEFKEDMHLKKHAIGQTIFAVNNWMRLIKRARKRGEGIVKDSDVIGQAHPHSVYEIYENLEATLKRLQIQISKMDTGYEMLPAQIGITSFINDFISRHPRSEFEYINLVDWLAKDDIPVVNIDKDNNITGISSTDFVLRKGDDLHMIYFPTEALELIFENIISNACSHGFSETEKAYKIRITGDINGKDLSIYVSNNGNPIHKDFSANDVFKYAKSTSDAISGHHGTGGYEVWKLMKQFGGSAEFFSTPDEEYTVTYKLTFQISNTIKTL